MTPERLNNIDDPVTLKGALYEGRTFFVKAPSALAPFQNALRDAIESAFPESAPVKAHRHMNTEDFMTRANKLRADIRKDTAIRQMFVDFMIDAGFDPDSTGLDAITLRIQPPDTISRQNTLSPHRDTWGSMLYSQINWWSPLYEIDETRTITMFPDYWETPVANSSAGWDWTALKDLPEKEQRKEDNLLPLVTRDIPEEAAQPVAPAPDDLFCFSGAHLHGSTRNTGDLTRFSFETRTIDIQDEKDGRGAPNIDGAAAKTGLPWFRRLSDNGKF